MKYSIKLAEGGKIIVLKKEIEKILFHRGGMLLLDQVTITDGNAVGELTVSPENCEGHEPKPGMLVFRGVDAIEMAFQLLGVIFAENTQIADLRWGKTCVARGITSVKFHDIVRPGDKLVLETSTEVDVGESRGILRVESSAMIASVDGKKKCTIASVAISAFPSW